MQFPYVGPCPYGAPMGRPEVTEDRYAKVYLFRVRPVSGDYDDGGAYWGLYGSAPLYCARDTRDGTSDRFRVFIRAYSRAEAWSKLQDRYPFVTLRRS